MIRTCTGGVFADYYYVKDLQGDIVAITNAAGAKVVEYTYDAWGKVLSTTGTLASSIGVSNPYRYRGYWFDTETGLYYLQSRYYDPQTGRFINADMLVSTGQGVLGSNMFAYCLNNPVKGVDPNGSMMVIQSLVECGGGKAYGFINGQKRPEYCNIPYGISTIGHSGCEAIAVYNARILLGKPKDFGKVKMAFEIMFLFGGGFGLQGEWGATPLDISRYLFLSGISHQNVWTAKQAESITNPGVFIISFWNEDTVFGGYHTVAVDYRGGSDYRVYNRWSDSTDYVPRDSTTAIIEKNERYIHGFFIAY